MKIFIYAMREFDELDVAERLKQEYGIDFGWSAEYPTMENVDLAQGYDAVSTTPCEIGAKLLEKFHDPRRKMYMWTCWGSTCLRNIPDPTLCGSP